MKSTILTAALILSGISAFAAGGPTGSREALLNRYTFDANYSLSPKDIKTGSVLVDVANKEVSVSLVRQVLCNPGMACSHRAYPPVIFDATLISTKIGGCNETIYTALTDKSNVDGTRVSIQVTDNSKLTCMTLVAVPATEVKVLTESKRTQEVMNHSFEGEKLSPALQ